MNARRLVFLVAFSAAFGGIVTCGGSPGSPAGPTPPPALTFSGVVKHNGNGISNVEVVLSGDASRLSLGSCEATGGGD